MADLEQYVDAVIDQQDRELMREASACLSAGAHRAAYITVWLACAESIRRKFTEAAVRDGRAAGVVREIQRREAQHKAVDRLLIDKALEYGFISDAEAMRLCHIYENRNVFGHPYEERPSDQLVITAACEAVDIVLGRPVALREGYLTDQAGRITTDRTFLFDDAQVVEQYARLVHSRSAVDRRTYFIAKLLDGFDGVFADHSLEVLQRRGIWFLRAFLLADPTIFDSWDPAEHLPDHQTSLPGILAHPELFGLVSEHGRDIVVNVLVQQTSNDPSYLRLLEDLRAKNLLLDRHKLMLRELIDRAPLSQLASSGLSLSVWWQRIVAQLKSHTWDIQNDAMLTLSRVGREAILQLGYDVQQELGRNLTQAAEGDAYRAVNFVGRMGVSGDPWSVPLVRGIVLEAFAHEDGTLRLKMRQLRSILRTLSAVPEDHRNAIIDAVSAALRDGQPRHGYMFAHERPKAIEIVQQAAGEAGLEEVARLIPPLEAVKVSADF
ncbi:MAG: hypothetical protein QOK16_3157 [Solirubrobacteraceae bacterium]|jgi:hypothetical protein|nr:hypothetical protein [Solirubrobacteraceae bacterium]MEA2188146.1 hypothetical protein [Solirubrobacteraceae bacterium]